MATYTMVGNTKIASSTNIVYRTLSIPATTNCKYKLTLTKGSYGTLPSYTSTETTVAQSLSVPWGTQYSITYTADTGYSVNKSSDSGTIATSDVGITVATSSVIYSTLSVPAVTTGIEKYALTLTKGSLGSLPSGYTSGTAKEGTAAQSLSIPYGTTYSITWTATTGYSLDKTSQNSGTITNPTATVRTFSLTIGATTNQKYQVTLTKGSLGTLPSYTSSSGQSAAMTINSIPYGSTYKVVYTSDNANVWSATNQASGTLTANASVAAASASVRYFTVTFPATTNQSYAVTFGTNTSYYKAGTVPSNIAARNTQATASCPFGTTWTITYSSPATGYNVGTSKSNTLTSASNYTESHNAVTLIYYNLSVGAATYQTYAVTFTANSTYGGTLPRNVSGQSAAKTFSCPYGSTAKVVYTLLSNTAQYTYSNKTADVSKTMTSAQSVAAASATRTVNKYTVTLSGSYANKNVRLTNSSGTVITSGSSYDYGTVIYVAGSLPTNYSLPHSSGQYTYSSLVCKVGSSTVSNGSTFTLTGNTTVDISCTRTTNYKVTISTTYASANVRLNNSSGAVIANGNYVAPNSTIYINGALPSNTAQYSYSALALTWAGSAVSAGTTKTITANTTVGVSCTRTLNQYTVTLTGSYANKNVRLTNSSGTVITSGSKYNYGTVIYVAGSLPTDTAQYKYSSLVCKYGGTAVSNGSTQTLTGDVTIDISCNLTTYYKITISTSYAGADIRLTNSSGAAISSGSYYAPNSVIYVAGWLPSNTAQYGYTDLTCTWNGTAVASGSTHTLTGDTAISVYCSQYVQTYTATLASRGNSTVTIACPGLATVTNAHMYGIPYGSTITVTATPASGYQVNSISIT